MSLTNASRTRWIVVRSRRHVVRNMVCRLSATAPLSTLVTAVRRRYGQPAPYFWANGHLTQGLLPLVNSGSPVRRC
jgi:hypothetical protein